MKIQIILILIVFSIGLAENYFEDDFSDGNADGWVEFGLAGFSVINENYVIFAGGLRGQGISLNGDNAGVMSVSDYSIKCVLKMNCGLNAGVITRYNSNEDWYYRLVFKPLTHRVLLERTKQTGPTVILDEYSIPIIFDEDYCVRLQVNGDSIQGKVWQGTFADEPVAWHLQASDFVQSEAGSFGLFAGGYGKVPWSTVFDNILVTSPVEQDFAHESWAIIKNISW